MDICVCADGNYLDYVPALFESISRHNKSGCNFYLITDELVSADIKNKISDIVSDNSFFDIVIDSRDFEGYKECGHFTKAMYYRFKIPDLIPESKWVLYLDCDMLVRGSLEPLFENLDERCPVYACRNPFFTRKDSLGLLGDVYFNSGLMVINSELWRRNSAISKLISIIGEKAEVLEMPDQDALNIFFDQQWCELPPQYNLQTSIILNKRAAVLEYRPFLDALRSPIVVHFSSPNKCWHKSCGGRYFKEYQSLKTSELVLRKGLLLDYLIRIKFFLKRVLWGF